MMSVLAWAWLPLTLLVLGLFLRASYWWDNRKAERIYSSLTPSVAYDEAVLLGPVSAWVAEGEARALCQWAANNAHCDAFGCGLPSTEPDCGDCEWEELRVLEQWQPVGYVRVRPCGVCPATRDPDLPWPMPPRPTRPSPTRQVTR
jgi:hypothetical protein